MLGPYAGTLRWDVKVGPEGGTQRWDSKVGPYGRTLKWDPRVGPQGENQTDCFYPNCFISDLLGCFL